jgi:outer membrane protein OmpA-like peptidoglycan-associated protein
VFNEEDKLIREEKYMKSVIVALLSCFILNCGIGAKSGLQEVGSIFGFITNAQHLPLDSARVEIAGESGLGAYTNSAGYYMLSDLPTGTYNLVITRNGYGSCKKNIRISTGAKNEFNVALEAVETAPGKISGIVVNLVNNTPLIVNVAVMDRNLAAMSDSTGKFEFDSLTPGYYLLKFTAFDYLDAFSEVTVFPGRTTEIMKPLLRNNTVITLYGINFEFGKALIMSGSYSVLDSAAGILSNYPEVEVEILGHTDSIGSDAANLTLSQKRAEAVRQYLIDMHMIEPVRLIAIGCGETKPIADNSTEEGRAKNRRVEFVITK